MFCKNILAFSKKICYLTGDSNIMLVNHYSYIFWKSSFLKHCFSLGLLIDISFCRLGPLVMSGDF